jgi:uncharacterized LabA/DUF88 family protein
MHVLVDYENLPLKVKNRPITALGEQLFFGIRHLTDSSKKLTRIHLRLYGGWYQEADLTKRAQYLSRQLASDFPVIKREADRTICIEGALAASLLSEPQFVWLHTYRERGEAGATLYAKEPHAISCYASGCPAALFRHFVNTRSCPKGSCDKHLHDVLERREQKLVDSMMICDVLELSRQGADQIVVVTSDDDLWPAIRTAVNAGTKLHQVHTRSRPLLPERYTTSLSGMYTAVVGF